MNPLIVPDPSAPMKTVTAYSSFGAANTTFSDTKVPTKMILSGPRYQMLAHREAFYRCTQHDHKIYDFDGRLINAAGQPMGAERQPFPIPLMSRRPVMPIRLGKSIVDSFTNILFGENRFPLLRVDGDADTEDFYRAISTAGKLPIKMIEARTIGGSTGTAGLSWAYRDGLPQFDVHNPRNLFVHSWRDRTRLIPSHVSEVFPFFKSQWNGKEMQNIYYWYRRDWTPDADVVYYDTLFDPNVEPVWVIDRDQSVPHDEGDCHFAWIQNIPNTEERDGFPDYDGLYDQFNAIDVENSIVHRGATLNLDPTVVLKMDRDEVNRMGVKKGSDHALAVGENGDAHYMELEGGSINAGIELIKFQRRNILETAQCVIPDPAEVAAQGVSSVTIKALYASMLSKADIIREQYAGGMGRGLRSMWRAAKKSTTITVTVLDTLTNETSDASIALALPPRIVRETDPDSGEEKITKVPRDPGEGGELDFAWPQYFAPTPDDRTKDITSLSLANGGKAFISVETSTEMASRLLGIDPAEERRRMASQKESDAEEMKAMMPPIDPATEGDDDAASGGKPPGGGKPPPFGKKPNPFGGPPKPSPFGKPKPKSPFPPRG